MDLILFFLSLKERCNGNQFRTKKSDINLFIFIYQTGIPKWIGVSQYTKWRYQYDTKCRVSSRYIDTCDISIRLYPTHKNSTVVATNATASFKVSVRYTSTPNSYNTTIVWISPFCSIKVLTTGITRNQLPVTKKYWQYCQYQYNNTAMLTTLVFAQLSRALQDTNRPRCVLAMRHKDVAVQ